MRTILDAYQERRHITDFVSIRRQGHERQLKDNATCVHAGLAVLAIDREKVFGGALKPDSNEINLTSTVHCPR